MSESQRPVDSGRNDDADEGVPMGTSGAAAPGTEAAGGHEEQRVAPTGEGADDARSRYADETERSRRDLQELDHPIDDPGPGAAGGGQETGGQAGAGGS